MKKIILLLVALLSLSMDSLAQEFTEIQKKLRSDIMLFLKEEGYMPELNTNGNIQFKKEGDKYFISIDKRDTSPMYLTVGLSYIYNDTYSVDKVSKALKELNAYKAVKVVCFEDSYAYHAEMYLVNAEHFKYTFYKLMDQLSTLKKELADYCSSSSGVVRSSSGTSESLLPIYGIDFNTTESAVKAMNYTEKKKEDDGSCRYVINSCWVYTKDGKVRKIIIGSYHQLPPNFQQLGFDRSRSYNQWVEFLKSIGFQIVQQYDAPTIEKGKGTYKNYFKADFRAKNPDCDYTVYFNFSGFDVPNADTPMTRPFMSIEPI